VRSSENLRCPFRAMNEYVRVTWGGVHPHSRIHLPQAALLCPVGAKRNSPRLKGHGCLRSGLQGHGMSAQGIALGLLPLPRIDGVFPCIGTCVFPLFASTTFPGRAADRAATASGGSTGAGAGAASTGSCCATSARGTAAGTDRASGIWCWSSIRANATASVTTWRTDRRRGSR